MADVLDGVPKHVLGWPIKTKTQITLTWIIPTVLELFVYIVLITSDISVCVQHFIEQNYVWASLTLAFIWLPAVLCFCTIITSPWQWPDYYVDNNNDCDCNRDPDGCSTPCVQFVFRLIFNFVCFPVGAISRFCRRLFWSVEALFHDRESYERHQALSKAAENSPFELYHFLQAFTQAAPQIVLQLYILLRENVFRNYDTTLVQSLSVIFSLLQMAVIVECYQRFESQKLVGRQYPWHALEQCQERKSILERKTEHPREHRRQISQLSSPAMEFPDVMKGFKEKFDDDDNGQDDVQNLDEKGDRVESGSIVHRKTLFVDENNFDNSGLDKSSLRNKSSMESIVENNSIVRATVEVGSVEALNRASSVSEQQANNNLDNVVVEAAAVVGDRSRAFGRPQTKEQGKALPPDVDEIKLLEVGRTTTMAVIKESGKSEDQTDSMAINVVPDCRSTQLTEQIVDFDTSPSSPPPPLPPIQYNKILNYPLNRLSAMITDMMMLNTELFIKERVPRLPEIVVNHEFQSQHQQEAKAAEAAKSAEIEEATDEVDGNLLVLPRRRRMVVGIGQDNFFGKVIAFTGWALFLLMRMLSLSLFAYFYLRETFYICVGHYVLMLACLFYEVKFHEKMERMLFYFFLAYVYIFCILEFKIKFVHIRVWYGMYIGFVVTQNLALSVWWYAEMNFESWWFEYSFRAILYSGGLSVCCLTVYYALLKPEDKFFYEIVENEPETNENP